MVLGLWILPASAFAKYLSGPPELIVSFPVNFQGERVFQAGNSLDSLLAEAGSSSGEVPATEPDTKVRESTPAKETDKPEVDPFSDEAIDDGGGEEDPFGEEAAEDFEKDPFAEEENEVVQMSDPLERWFNRPVYVFNDHFYEYFMRPVAQTYKDLLAENIRIMIRNLFNTVTFPSRLVNSLLQLKFDKAGRVVARVFINCTLGFLCMVDVANDAYGLEPVDEDFGQTLGFYGIPSGPYIVLPLLGPSSVRDGIGRGVDALLNPLFWIVPDFTTGAGITSEQMVNEVSFYIEDIKAFKEGAIDPYISFRNFYNQNRKNLVDK